MRKVASLIGLVAVLGCDDNRNVAVSNTNPLGTVGGVVLDVEGEGPLVGGAMVTLQSAGSTLTATTDPASGVYSFAKVPAGDFFLTFTSPNYAPAYVPGTLTGAVGNFPVSNPQTTMPTVELFKTTGTFSVALVDDRGAPVSGVTVTARVQVKYFAYNYPYGSGGGSVPILSPFGQYAVTAMSDANGIAAFTGLPTNYAFNLLGPNTTQMYVDVAPIVVAGTTTYQFAGATYEVNPTRVTQPGAGGLPPPPTSVYTLQLVGPNSQLTVLYSSIDYFVTHASYAVAAVVPTDKPISITFNQAVDQSSLRAQLLDETGASLGNMTPTFTAGNIVSLAAPFAAGKRYNLALHAAPLSLAASNNTNTYNTTAPFFAQGPATLTVSAALTTIPIPGIAGSGKVVMLTFNDAVGLGKGTTPTLNCVAWYEGADLDASGNVSYQGEYATALPACPSTVAPTIFDMTKLVPFEPNPSVSIPTTGFANKWYAQVDDTVAGDGCKGGVATCTKPAAASVMHLLFSHLDSSQTFTRANGAVVGDMTVTIQ